MRWTYWEANLATTSYSGKEYGQGKKQTLLKIREKHTRDNRHPVSIFCQDISANQAHAVYRFSETTFILVQTTSAAKGLLLRSMKSRSLVESIWVKKEKDHSLMTRTHLKSWKINHNFSYISEFHKIVLSWDINQCSLKETLNIGFKKWTENEWDKNTRTCKFILVTHVTIC